MITTVKPISSNSITDYSAEYITTDSLFFDIETTGLSAANSMVFLIGAIYFDGKCWQLKQFLAENADDERCIIRDFFALAAQYHTLIHFNGTTFDIPYLKERAKFHSITEPLSQMESLDLYQKFRPLKKLLNLPRMNQQTLEQFLQWPRQDQLSGKQMITLFKKYAASGEKLIADLLLLHNHDDLLGMIQLLRLFAYPILAEGNFDQIHITTDCSIFDPDSGFEDSGDTQSIGCLQTSGILCIQFHLEQPLPADLVLTCPVTAADLSSPTAATEVDPITLPHAAQTETHIVLTVKNNLGSLTIPIFFGELKYFFPDYRNYYYLPAEDQAVHKSIGAYVDPEHRENAKPATCYVRKKGVFLPQPAVLFEPAFYPEYHSKHIYFEYAESFASSSEKLSAYIQALLKYLLSGFIRR